MKTGKFYVVLCVIVLWECVEGVGANRIDIEETKREGGGEGRIMEKNFLAVVTCVTQSPFIYTRTCTYATCTCTYMYVHMSHAHVHTCMYMHHMFDQYSFTMWYCPEHILHIG